MLETPAALRELLVITRRIAVVGMSPNPERPSHYVARYMQERGYTIIPVNPGQTEIAGLKCYSSLRDIEEPVDMVNVFRRPEHVPPLVEDAIAIGAGSLWLQMGVVNLNAARDAEAAGLAVVMDRCLKVEHARCCPEHRADRGAQA